MAAALVREGGWTTTARSYFLIGGDGRAPGAAEPIGALLAFHDIYAPADAADLGWTRWYGWGYQPPEGVALRVFDVGEDIHLRVEVRGDLYAAYLNNSPTPTTQFATPEFPDGLIGLWDNAAGDTAFDNVLIQTCRRSEGDTDLALMFVNFDMTCK